MSANLDETLGFVALAFVGPRSKIWHESKWTVVIDPPHMMRALHTFSTQAMAAQYMRSLRANNPHAAEHSYILKPARR